MRLCLNLQISVTESKSDENFEKFSSIYETEIFDADQGILHADHSVNLLTVGNIFLLYQTKCLKLWLPFLSVSITILGRKSL